MPHPHIAKTEITQEKRRITIKESNFTAFIYTLSHTYFKRK